MRTLKFMQKIVLCALITGVVLAACTHDVPHEMPLVAEIIEAVPEVIRQVEPDETDEVWLDYFPVELFKSATDDEDGYRNDEQYHYEEEHEPYESEPTPVPTPEPTPRPVHLDNIGSLSNDSLGWHFVRQEGGPPRGRETASALRPFDAFFIGDTELPRVFLTFDSGYERGFTPSILDTLSYHNVHAAFFLTESYIRRNPELVQRKIVEGHLIANHSVTHRNFPTLTDDEIAHELHATADRLYQLTGHTMSPFFRPPAGVYSRRVLALTQYHGYNTVFWSFAHRDWVQDEQPPVEVTFQRVVGSLHNGMIILLHTNSESNTLALSGILEAIKEAGFEFASMYELLYL